MTNTPAYNKTSSVHIVFLFKASPSIVFGDSVKEYGGRLRVFIQSLSDCHRDRLLAPAALAFARLCRAREGEDSENQTRSQTAANRSTFSLLRQPDTSMCFRGF